MEDRDKERPGACPLAPCWWHLHQQMKKKLPISCCTISLLLRPGQGNMCCRAKHFHLIQKKQSKGKTWCSFFNTLLGSWGGREDFTAVAIRSFLLFNCPLCSACTFSVSRCLRSAVHAAAKRPYFLPQEIPPLLTWENSSSPCTCSLRCYSLPPTPYSPWGKKKLFLVTETHHNYYYSRKTPSSLP